MGRDTKTSPEERKSFLVICSLSASFEPFLLDLFSLPLAICLHEKRGNRMDWEIPLVTVSIISFSYKRRRKRTWIVRDNNLQELKAVKKEEEPFRIFTIELYSFQAKFFRIKWKSVVWCPSQRFNKYYRSLWWERTIFNHSILEVFFKRWKNGNEKEFEEWIKSNKIWWK